MQTHIKIEKIHGAVRFSAWREGVMGFYAMLRGSVAKLYYSYPPEMTETEFAEYQKIHKEEANPDSCFDLDDGLTAPYIELIGTIEVLPSQYGAMPFLETINKSVVFSFLDMMEVEAIMTMIAQSCKTSD